MRRHSFWKFDAERAFGPLERENRAAERARQRMLRCFFCLTRGCFRIKIIKDYYRVHGGLWTLIVF